MKYLASHIPLSAIYLAARCAVTLGFFTAFHAHADVWSYVDERGVAHFASSQMDARYELFFREVTALEPVAKATSTAPTTVPKQPVVLVSAATARLIAYMESAPGYKAAQHHVRAAAQAHHVEYPLLLALITAESGFDATAVSPKGAMGLMQLMPATARRYGVVPDHKANLQKKLFDPKTNINAGTRYLRDLIEMFPGRTDLALAAYNAGEGAVQRAGNKIPNYPETQNYVRTVTQIYAGLKPAPSPVQTASAASPTGKRPEKVFYGNGYTLNVNPQPGATGRGNMPE